MDREARDHFIETWGAMGSLWGINRSVARIHALLITAASPLTLDDISVALEISRGNASMSLKELATWGVVRKTNLPADRRDHWDVETDIWAMFFRIVRERKRREFDPAVAAVRQALAALDEETDPAVRARLEQMRDLLSTGDRVMRRFLESERSSRTLLGLLAGLTSDG